MTDYLNVKCNDCGCQLTMMTAMCTIRRNGVFCPTCVDKPAPVESEFRVGDVLRGHKGALHVVKTKGDISNASEPWSGYSLAYRPSGAALAVFAKPESVEFMELIGKMDARALFFRPRGDAGHHTAAYSADLDSVATVLAPHWSRYGRKEIEPLWRRFVADGLAHPDSARRWLEREAARKSEPAPGEQYSVTIGGERFGFTLNDTTAVEPFVEPFVEPLHEMTIKVVEVTTCALCGDPLSDHDPSTLVAKRWHHASCAGQVRRRNAAWQEEMAARMAKVDPYAQHRQEEERFVAKGGQYDPSGRDYLTDSGAMARAENVALFGRVPERFTADRIPEPAKATAHPWTNDDWEEGHS